MCVGRKNYQKRLKEEKKKQNPNTKHILYLHTSSHSLMKKWGELETIIDTPIVYWINSCLLLVLVSVREMYGVLIMSLSFLFVWYW